MTACTSFLAFFAEQTLAFAEKMHSRPDRWPLEAAKRLEARAHAVRSAGTLGCRRQHSAETSDRVILVDKPKVCQRSEALASLFPFEPAQHGAGGDFFGVQVKIALRNVL